jgi:16S rRNA (cytosine1402-N4)-methyltransferase
MISTEENHHIPVLYKEIEDLFSDTHGTILDCTVGFAGHSYNLLESNKNIKLICNDKDSQALSYSKEKLSKFKDRVIFVNKNFGDLFSFIKDNNIELKGVLADIGISSYQVDNDSRGFGFNSNFLDMRMDQKESLDAKSVVNNYTKSQLEKILKEFGEVREYKKVARVICEYRKDNIIQSAKELSQLLSKHLHNKKINPCTLVFQAIRIEVNRELEELSSLLWWIKDIKLKDATIAIISFHSLEDRVVKNNFKNWSKNCICPDDIMRCICTNDNSYGKIITKKPIIPTNQEIKYNPRSRSAKMRIFRTKDE